MPCDTSYMQPTLREAEAQRTARLLVYVLEAKGMKIPTWISEEADNIYSNDRRLTPLLCATIKGLTDQDREAIVYNAKSRTSRDLADWWEDHREEDREREEEEQAKAQREALQQSARAKLTDEEWKALDLA